MLIKNTGLESNSLQIHATINGFDEKTKTSIYNLRLQDIPR